jgi:hypothetical protein
MKLRKIGAALAAVVASGACAWALNIPLVTGPQDVNNLNNYLNTLINSINTLVTSQTLAPYNNFRNVVDNGNMVVNQRGTGEVTCGTTTIPSSAYSADRWGCNANVTSGAGFAAVVTASPAPPATFTNSQTLYRKTGALLQPVCMMQELGTTVSTSLAGQSVVASLYEQPLAGFVADNGGAFNVYIFTGTGTDQGLQSFTASPAITPAWTGIATTGSFSFTNATAAWVRYSGSAVIPAAATEIAIAVCFTPTASGAGATDGLAFTGVQLEVSSGAASSYEFKPVTHELQTAYRHFYRVTETTAVTMRGSCTNLTSSIANCIVPFPTVMRRVPTMTYATGFAIAVAAQTSMSNCSAIATSTTATSIVGQSSVLMSCATSAAGGALGTSTTWGDGSGTGLINASADY